MRPRLLALPLAAGAIAALPGAASAGAAVRHAVAVVVEIGGAAHRLCAEEPEGSTGATALADALAAAGMAAARYDPSSGLLCAIDGQPATGCGSRGPGGYAYWAYFHGVDGSWAYASDGPGAHRTQPGEVEGWRFEQAGTGRPGDPAPVTAADAEAICAAAQRRQPSTTTTTAPAPGPGPVAVTGARDDASTTTTTTGVPVTERERAARARTTPVSRPEARSAAAGGSTPSTQGSPAGALLGGGIALGLLALGSTVLWRRRARG